jgi:hypothetical protein
MVAACPSAPAFTKETGDMRVIGLDIHRAFAAAVALAAAFVPPGTDHALDIGLHDQLQHGRGDAAKKATLAMLGQ